MFDQSELNETSPELKIEETTLLFIGTYFGELNVYKFEDQSLSLVKQWKFKSQITSVAVFNFWNDRLEQVARLFEH